MNSKRHSKNKWAVHRHFEPHQLSREILVQAYEQVVSQRVRVFSTTSEKSSKTTYPRKRRIR
jgi:hypothetical protein